MSIDYVDVRSANSPDGLIGLLRKLGHEPELNWDDCADVISVLLDASQPKSVRNALNDAAATVRSVTSLSGETSGIECYVAILNPGQKLIDANTRSLSHAFRHVSNTKWAIDETLLFIGRTPEDHVGEILGDTKTVEWATIRLERVYRGASKSEELLLTRLDWNPRKVTRHTLDCLSSLAVDALPGQVVDEEVERFRKEVRRWLNKEHLSQRFFREFYRRFENALDHFQLHAKAEGYDQFAPGLKKEFKKYTKNDRKIDQNREEAAKYLLKQALRILFLHFLQEKEWLCRDRNFLLNQWRRYEHSTRSIANYDATRNTGFHEQVLIPLFFETLNRRRPDDSLTNWGPTQWDKGDREGMPYLNGGIFEVDQGERFHVHIEQTDDGQTVSPKILIPDSVFSGDRDYDPKINNEILDGSQVSLLAFLDDFHFTIAEDTPIDEAVALDPELMGKIFENLLVSRHSDGAYYTPRSIVRFQCKDTLARYLEEQLADLSPQFDQDWFLGLSDLSCDFKDGQEPWNHELFTPVVADRIKQALMECKVLDPAVGSGAYLLGMMTEMLRLRQLCHMVRVKEFVDRGSTKFYEWKRDIIRNSLYGVDINPQAVSICHLRLWLAMIVDQDRNSSSPLPNLESQITTGDSLRDSINGNRIFVAPGQEGQATLWSFGGGVDEEGPNDEPIKDRIERIQELNHELFDENTSPTKREESREERNQSIQEMMLEGLDQLEHYELKQLNKSKMSATKRDKAKNEVIAKFADTRRRINEGTFTSIFSYEAFFGYVFQREGRRGFDIVIGNPPYLLDQGSGGVDSNYKDIQQSLGLASDNLYSMFWAKSIKQLTRDGGQVSFITPDTPLTIRGHKETREILLQNGTIHYAIQAGNWFFTFNNAWTVILTMTVDKSRSPRESQSVTNTLIAYDITKLPSGDNTALQQALSMWKDTPQSAPRSVGFDGQLIHRGDESTWYLELDSHRRSHIARYEYPQSLIWRNSNLPIFHTCPYLFGLSWDNLDWEYTVGTDSIVTDIEKFGSGDIEMCGESVSMTYLDNVAIVRKGLDVGDIIYFLRRVESARGQMEIVDRSLVLTREDLTSIHNDEPLRSQIVKTGIPETMFEGRYLVPFAKPPTQDRDDLCMFYSEPEFFMDWSERAISELHSFTIADARRRYDPDFIGDSNQEKKRSATIRANDTWLTEHLHMTMVGENAPQIWLPNGGVSGQGTSIVLPKSHSTEDLMAYLSSNLFAMLSKGLRGSLANTTVGTLIYSPIPVALPDCKGKVEALIEFKKNGGKLARDNEQWVALSNFVASEIGLDEDCIEEINRWNIRRYVRPGIIE